MKEVAHEETFDVLIQVIQLQLCSVFHDLCSRYLLFGCSGTEA